MKIKNLIKQTVLKLKAFNNIFHVDWHNSKQLKTKPKNKNSTLFYIHIGPGKTGTSVIQKWCLNNRKYLMKNNIYYPTHALDLNGISSGHESLILTHNGNSWELDKNKIALLKEDVQRVNPKIVLLSSERFWLHMDRLLEEFKNVQLIFYIRSPLEHLESAYNQQVKRNHATKPIRTRYKNFKASVYGIPKLLETIKIYGKEQFIIKIYDRDAFREGNVLFDFFKIFSLRELPGIDNCVVNSSYCIEALEFKRYINNSDLSNTESKQLDKILQGYPDGNYSYSLLPPKIYREFKAKVLVKMKKLLTQLEIDHDIKAKYLKNIKKQKQKIRVKQSISQREMDNLMSYIEKNNIDLAETVKYKLKQLETRKLG